MINTKSVVNMLLREKGIKNAQGNTIHRMFLSTDRYLVDFDTDRKTQGWEQFDTDQDTSYFGVWTNKTTKQVLTYMEGDWSLVVCEDTEHYNAEIREMLKFYREGYEFKTLDNDGTMTTYVQDRQTFLISPVAA